MTDLIGGRGPIIRKALTDSISLPAFILLTTMIGFGSLANLAGFNSWMAAASTLLIWGLPGQLAMVELASQGQGLIAIVMACSLANARFLPMVVSFLPYIQRSDSRIGGLLLCSQMLSINSWAVSLREFPSIAPEWRRFYYAVFASSIALAAVTGTILGIQASTHFPRPIVLGFIFLSPLFFALVLVSAPAASTRLAMILGCLIVPVAYHWFPSVDLLLTGVLAGTGGFFLGRNPSIKRWFE